jgi:hypothetical protein
MALFKSTCLLLLSSQAHGWITVSPEGNMTLMTTAQVGDWDHGTTGEPKDLYVTGDVHIGKTNGSLFVQGDIMLDGAFSSDNADFTSGVLTGNISSDTALYIYSGHQEDIELQPGLGGSVVVKSNVYMEDYTITAKSFNATQSLELGDITLDVTKAEFSTRTGNITFAPAEGGRILLDQHIGDAVLLIKSSDGNAASSASLQLQNAVPANYAAGLNEKGFSVSATETGDFQVASETPSGEARALLTIDGTTWETSLSGALRVERDGVNITGGLDIATEGLTILQGGANITGGMIITDTGLEVILGGMTISQGGATVTGGIVVEDSEVCFSTDLAAPQAVQDACSGASLAGTNLDASDSCRLASLASCVATAVDHCAAIVGQVACDDDASTQCE